MRIQGKEIRDRLKRELQKRVLALGYTPRLVVISAGEDPVVRRFVDLKRRFAQDIGVDFVDDMFPSNVTFAELQKVIKGFNDDPLVNGIIVQLPLPAHLDTDTVLGLIVPEKDVDILSSRAHTLFVQGRSPILPPVLGAIAEICHDMSVSVRGKKVLILGQGRLVGAPAAVWFKQKGGEVVVVDKPVQDLARLTGEADIVVCGTGVAGLIKPLMLKKGVILLDAGTSEEGGVMVGDADPRCEEVASVFTPVPGGIGPITVAMIFENLLMLVQKP